jgi:hypothetical protein
MHWPVVGKGFHSLTDVAVAVPEEVVILAGELWKHVEVQDGEAVEMWPAEGFHNLIVASLQTFNYEKSGFAFERQFLKL